jgi:enterochelin esterase-like enzyme
MKSVRAVLSAVVIFCTTLFGVQVLAQGTLEEVRVFSPALEGNLEGNDPERGVFVYLPPGYADSDERYPVVYFLHGYGVSARVYVEAVLRLPGAIDEAMAGGAEEVIIVMPDAFTRFGGSFYSNSPTIGDWESFIARDLVSYIDTHYRTLPQRESRGLSGHSMGGYGTLRVGMAYPEVFGALYAMSSGGLLNNAPTVEAVKEQLVRMAEGIKTEERSTANGMQAQAAAWAPNPQNPPYYFDLPFNEKGELQPLIAEKWTTNSMLLTADQHVPALKSFRAIMLDVGNEDGLEAANTQLDAALTRLGVAHNYEIYEGTHGNKVGQRFVENVLPLFAEHLELKGKD